MHETNAVRLVSDFRSDDFRRCLGEFVTGVTVITTIAPDGKVYGLTANSFSSVSLDPPLILWSLRLNATNFGIFSTAEHFVVNILADDQVHISNQFAKSGPDRFNGVEHALSADGVPLLHGCLAHLECRNEMTYPGGDHVVFIGRVMRIAQASKTPLALRGGKYMVVHPHDTGPLHNEQDQPNVASLRAIQTARRYVEDLAYQTGKSAALAVLGNLGPTIVWGVDGKERTDPGIRCGLVMSLLESATGSVFAAFGRPDVIRPLLELELAQGVRRGAGGAQLTRHAIELRLDQVRADQMASVDDAVQPGATRGITAYSVPVFDGAGEVVFGLTVLANAASFKEADSAVAALRSSAHALSLRLKDAP